MPLVTPRFFARWRVLLLMVFLRAAAFGAADAPSAIPAVSTPAVSAPMTDAPAVVPAIPAPADISANVVLLWPQGAPGATGTGSADEPAIFPFLPPAATNTGAGILIVPSESAPSHLPDQEGMPTAQWLNAHGIAAFVLRYRSAPGYSSDVSVADVNRALQYVHAHAADFHLSATRIGVLGYAAGGKLAAEAAFVAPPQNNSGSTDPVDAASPHPDFMALIYGADAPAAGAALPPPTFLVGSTNAQDNLSGMIDLWNFLRNPRTKVPVEAHFFPKVDARAGLAADEASLGPWPDLFYNWVRAYGFLTDQTRVAIRGSVLLDGKPLPYGYLILTPLDGVGAGPIIARIFNSTQGIQIGSFTVPVNQGPVPGRYKVDVRQNTNRWLSNTFSADLIRDPAFGHSRILSPSIDDQHSFTKAHPNDKDDLMVEIKPEGSPDLKIEVFTK